MNIKTSELRTYLKAEFEKDFKDWKSSSILFALKYELSEELRDSLHAALDVINNKIITSAEKDLNKRLNKYNLEVTIIETSELYEEDIEFKDSDEYWNLPMFEAYVSRIHNNEQLSETTGRYCDIHSVLEEIVAFAEIAIEEIN